MRKDGKVNLSATTEALSVHVSFVAYWLVTDIPSRANAEEELGKIRRRWSSFSRTRLPGALNEAMASRVADCRQRGDHKELMRIIRRSNADADKGQPLVLPRGLANGGRGAGDSRWSVEVHRYLEEWTRAFFRCRLEIDAIGGLGLVALDDIKRGDIVARSHPDPRAPDVEYSSDGAGTALLGPFALANCGCAGCANVEITQNWCLQATKRIGAGKKILARYAPPDKVRWKCPPCKTKTNRVPN